MSQLEGTQPQQVDRAWVSDFASRWEAAWNSHEPERLLGLMTEDIVYDDSAWPVTMRGHDAVREFLEFSWRAFPDLRFELVEGPYLVPGEPKASFTWNGTGTHSGPVDPPGFAPTGRRVAFSGADFHEYRDGRVCRLRIVFDMMELARQIGTVPPVGSRLEKAGAAVQRLGMKVRSRMRR